MSDERLAQAIDEVAYALTRGEPGSAFRAEVMARIDAGATPRASWRAAWLLAPVAVAAAIVIAGVFARRPGPASRGATAPETLVAATEPAKPMPTVRAIPAEPAGQAGSAGPKRTSIAVARPTGSALQLEALAAPPLDLPSIAVNALTSDPIQIDRLEAVPSMAVAPLEITDIQQRRYE